MIDRMLKIVRSIDTQGKVIIEVLEKKDCINIKCSLIGRDICFEFNPLKIDIERIDYSFLKENLQSRVVSLIQEPQPIQA